jgi:hypothetical protein
MDDALIDALAQGLTALDLDSYQEDAAVRFRRWPTVAVTVGATSVTDKQDTLLLHADLTFAYNAAKPDSLIRTCVTGIGSDRDEAVMDAASEWVRSWAPPLISVLNSAPVLGAEWFPASALDTVSGWDAFSSPYVLRGLPDDAEALTRILKTTPLLGLVREELPRYLDASSLLQSVSLFVGAVGKTTYAEVQINGAILADLAARLTMLPRWEHAQWGTARQCLVLINAAGRARGVG